MARIFTIIAVLCLCAPAAWCETNNATVNAEDVLGNFALLEKGQTIEYGGRPMDSVNDFEDALKGLTITGTGSVVGVISNPKRAKVTILSPGSSPEKGYNIVLITTQDAKNDLFKNDRVLFTGTIGNVSAWRNVSIDVEGTYELIKQPPR